MVSSLTDEYRKRNISTRDAALFVLEKAVLRTWWSVYAVDNLSIFTKRFDS